MLNTLNVSITGLNAAKIAVENVSNDIANENTPGYKIRVVQLDELAQTDSRFTGRGVSASHLIIPPSTSMLLRITLLHLATNLFIPFLTVNLFLYLYILNEINLILCLTI